jgi:hypothetical protein
MSIPSTHESSIFPHTSGRCAMQKVIHPRRAAMRDFRAAQSE